MKDDQVIEWMKNAIWLDGADLETEFKQARQEGRDLSLVDGQFRELLADGRARDSLHWRQRAALLVDRVQELPYRSDHPNLEPDDLPSIREARPGARPMPAFRGGEADFKERLGGGLVARMCGCLLGKPFEGWPREDIRIWGEETANWPLYDYLHEPTPEEAAAIGARKPLNLPEERHLTWTRGRLTHMVEDDDINYTVAGWDVVDQKGASFEPVDIARYWCSQLPIFRTYTAERVAYRNFIDCVLPPQSAAHRNPHREWIGAQIRADYYGYANPGNPERAAEWAWRDASVSHVKNGIYGAMWVAAMLGSAYVLDRFEDMILAGLAQIPGQSRLREGVQKILQGKRGGRSYEQQVEAIHAEWNERDPHDWCHTISNAQIVAVALLYGENDYTKTISRAVMAGFDTDCNGATTGSVWGVRNGRKAIPELWTAPIGDRVRTHLTDRREVSINWLIDKMVETARRGG